MKRSQVLAISIIVLMMLAALPTQQSRAASTYSERLNVFVAGSNALWYMTFSGVNGSSKLSQFESTPGLTWYNVTAIKTSNWQSDFQVFGPQGYNLLAVPFLPSEGLFLTVGSDSYADALSAADSIDPYLLSSFVSLSNATSSFAFYSPLSFNDVVPPTLLALLPSTAGGFAGAITSSGLDGTLSPMVTLEGEKSSTGFDHTLIVGSITNKALDSQNRPSILTYFGTTIAALPSSGHSSSSSIQVRFLDGLVNSKDPAVISNDSAHFTGSYSLTLAAGRRVLRLNASVVQQPVQLVAARLVDVGVLRTPGQNVDVTISLTNLSNSTALTKVTLDDKWWNPSLFKLVTGNSTISILSISPATTVTPTYKLQYIGAATEKLTIPSSTVRYSYSVGAFMFNGRAVLNPVTLSLGADDAVVFAYVTPSGGFGKSFGGTQDLKVVVKNVGTQAATAVTVAGQPVSGLAADGGTASVKISQLAQGLLAINVTKAYDITYSDLQGQSLSATTNIVPLIFSHSSMKLGLPEVVVSALLSRLKPGGTNLTLTFATSNLGPANVTSFAAHALVPKGLGCGITNGIGISCSSGQLSLSYPSLAGKAIQRTYMKVNVTTPLNYFFSPFSFDGFTAGIHLRGNSDAIAVPTGIVLSKIFAPSQLFGGMVSKVSVVATNSGPFAIYNASVNSAVDTFDLLAPSSVPSGYKQVVPPRDNLNFSYAVTSSSTFGNLTSSPVSSNLYFGGRVFSIRSPGPVVSVYQPVSVTITTSPSSPIEGKSFTLNVTIHNPAGVNVSNVVFTLPVPPGLSLSDLQHADLAHGVLTVSLSSMEARSTYPATGVGVASSGIAIPFDKAKLTFSYEGVTVNGKLPSLGILIGENVTSRYLIPTALVLIALLATAFYIRRRAAPSVPASQK